MRRGLRWSLAAGTASALTAMLVHGVVDTPLWGMKLAFLPWLLFALVTNLFLAMSAALSGQRPHATRLEDFSRQGGVTRLDGNSILTDAPRKDLAQLSCTDSLFHAL